MHIRHWRRIVTAFGLLSLLCIGATTVSAHARLVNSTPADKAVVTTQPAQILLTFSQETSATQSNGSVVDTNGAAVSTGFKVDLNDRTKMTIDLKPNLPNGVYTVKYHTLTEDDNGMVDGTFAFMLQAAAQQAAPPAATSGAGTATTGTAAPTATIAAATATMAATATRPAGSVVATGTGGRVTPIAPVTLPQTGQSASGKGSLWLMLVVLLAAAAIGVGFLFRARTR